MFEQDYIIRVIKEMVRTLLELIFHIHTEESTLDLLETAEEKEVFQVLLDMADAGNINEAENRLYEFLQEDDEKYLRTAILFYSHLNDKSDEFLETHGYSREEIGQGLKDVVKRCGYQGIAEAFLE